ncbi:hypothetical protein AAG570_010790 [Ranatra chinensis]|uniref:Endonuclease/exonuclease/phosphatase domain-containing protein n=1 Tax=Ranatra chinensis TaxID=642074 RepID=A0ABD0Z5M5_9HEMI
MGSDGVVKEGHTRIQHKVNIDGGPFGHETYQQNSSFVPKDTCHNRSYERKYDHTALRELFVKNNVLYQTYAFKGLTASKPLGEILEHIRQTIPGAVQVIQMTKTDGDGRKRVLPRFIRITNSEGTQKYFENLVTYSHYVQVQKYTADEAVTQYNGALIRNGVIGVQVDAGTRPVNFFSVYKPPDTKLDCDVLHNILSEPQVTVVAGDFNANLIHSGTAAVKTQRKQCSTTSLKRTDTSTCLYRRNSPTSTTMETRRQRFISS